MVSKDTAHGKRAGATIMMQRGMVIRRRLSQVKFLSLKRNRTREHKCPVMEPIKATSLYRRG